MGTVALFSIIGVTAIVKKGNKKPNAKTAPAKEIAAAQTPVISIPASPKIVPISVDAAAANRPAVSPKDDFPNIDRIFQLFTTGPTKLPIVETVHYSSSVPWLKGRPAWIADYASHYNTSRHFIARSLNGKPDYFSQKVVGREQI